MTGHSDWTLFGSVSLANERDVVSGAEEKVAAEQSVVALRHAISRWLLVPTWPANNPSASILGVVVSGCWRNWLSLKRIARETAYRINTL
jgi:hypothetical protein